MIQVNNWRDVKTLCAVRCAWEANKCFPGLLECWQSGCDEVFPQVSDRNQFVGFVEALARESELCPSEIEELCHLIVEERQ